VLLLLLMLMMILYCFAVMFTSIYGHEITDDS